MRDARHRIGRIIMLGNSSDETSEPAEVRLFDYSKEDKDLESQVDKGQARVTDMSDPEGEDEKEEATNEKIQQPTSPLDQKTNHTETTPAKSVNETKQDEDDQPGTPKRRTLEYLGSSSVPEKLFTPPKSETGGKEAADVASPSTKTNTEVKGDAENQ